MTQKALRVGISVVTVLLLAATILMTVFADSPIIVHTTSAQPTSNSENMTATMTESARIHLKTADDLLIRGNTKAALEQISLAELQLSLLRMSSEGTTMNQTAASEFIVGGSLSSMKMPANCVIDGEGKVRCM
jgi:ABC-type transport system involved in cytochrome bd biosynthesis fused ATPase/permease subunit